MFQKIAGVSVQVIVDWRLPSWVARSPPLLLFTLCPRFIHQWSSVLLLFLYRKMKSSLSAFIISPLLRVCDDFNEVLVSASVSQPSLVERVHDTTYLFFDLFNTKSLFTCFSLCRGHGRCWCVLCAAVRRHTFRWYPRSGMNSREDRGVNTLICIYAVLIFSAV